MMPTSGSLSMLLAALLGFFAGGEPGERRPVEFKLQDFRGAWHQLDEVKDRKLVVLAFLGTECPLANVYAPRLAELARGYEKKGVVFFGVDSNPQDAPSALARFAKDCDLPFPLLKDVGNELADKLGVLRSPEVFVLDSDRSENPSNPDPSRTVRWGEQTRDEMLVGYVEVALADQDLSLGLPKSRKLDDGRYEVTFRYRPPASTKVVYLAGEFNEWKPAELRMEGPDSSGHFQFKQTLSAGRHEYKYVLDGKKWRHDPGNRRQAGMYHNSVIQLGDAKSP